MSQRRYFIVPKDGGPVQIKYNIQDVAYWLRKQVVPDHLIVAEGLPAITLGQVSYRGVLKELELWEASRI